MSDRVPAGPDRFSSLAELRAAQTRLAELRRDGSDGAALWDAVERFVVRGRAVGVLLDSEDDRWTVQNLLDYWAAALSRAGRVRCDSSLAEFDPDLAPELPDNPCPYVGLDAFGEKDGSVFFGREALVDQLVSRVGAQRLVAVVGPSGAGKSSLVFAGLVSRLRAGALPGSERWTIVSMVPGAEPRGVLARLLEAARPTDGSPDTRILLVIDQLEELFTLCTSQVEQAGFVEDVLGLVASDAHRAVVTMRGDFESFVARYPAFQDHFNAGRFAVTPVSAAELRQAIERPAAMVGLTFEAGVVDRLLQELVGEPAGLPLLQFTLLRLWQERHRNRVTAASYARVGGGRLAIAHATDELYDAMIPQDQMTARRILLRVGIAVSERHEQTRTRVPRSQFFDGGEDPARVERVLDKLIAARLLRQTPGRSGAEPQVEVAHEALVRNWPRLASWLQEAQVSAVTKRRFDAKVAEWLERGGGTAKLLDAVEIAEAEQWTASDEARRLGHAPELAALVAASRLEIEDKQRRELRELHRRARRKAWIFVLVMLLVTTCVLIAVLSLTVLQYRSAQEARRQEAASQRMTLRLLALTYMEQGRSLLIESRLPHPMRALPFLLAARSAGVDGSVVRMLFGEASRSLPLVTFVGHSAAVNTVAYSRDGTHIVSASDDHTARIWDASTAEPVWQLEHRSNLTSAAFSPDGARVVTASLDHTARVWDAATGKPVTPPLEHEDSVVAAAFDPAGTRVVTASFDKTARIWDAATGKPLAPPLRHDDAVQTAAFSPDGTRVITASLDKTARIWDAATGRPIGAPLIHRDILWAAEFSPDGTRAITASDDHTARIWDAVTGKPVGPPLEHQGGVVGVAFNPTGSQVVTSSEDSTARVWDVVTGRPVTPPLTHQNSVRSARFSLDGTRVITASVDGTAQVWDASTGESLRVLEHTDSVLSAAFSADGDRVITASDDGLVRIWNVSNRSAAPAASSRDTPADEDRPVRRWATPRLEHQDAVAAAAFSPDGTRVVTASWDRTARVWDASGAPVTPPLEHQGAVVASAFSHSGTRVITASHDKTARIWDAVTGKPVAPPLEHRSDVTAAAFSPDDTHAVTASSDGTAQIWDAATGKPSTPPLAHKDRVSTAQFSPDGTRVVTASADKTAQVWDAATGKPIGEPLRHQDAVFVAAFSPDGTRVVTASADKTARVWDAVTGKAITLPLTHKGSVLTASFSPDGTRIVTASYDKTASVWDVGTGKLVTAPLEHSGPISAAVFSPDGELIATGSTDATARVWDAATGKPVTPPLIQSYPIAAVAFSPDGTRLVTASYDMTARIWDLSIDQGTLDDWRQVTRCSLFALVNGVLTTNPSQVVRCPPH